MKNKYITYIILLAFSRLVNGQQVPNGGFETWANPSQPDGWYTFSSGGFVNLAGKDATSWVEGTSSAKIQTSTIAGQTTYEILSLGTAYYKLQFPAPLYIYNPVYFPFRPDTLFFAYKYYSPGIDTASAYIKLSKGNTALLEAELPLIKNEQWSLPFILLTTLYTNDDIPDSLLIQFKSSKTRGNFFGVDGSTLNVDDVHFGYAGLSSSAREIKENFSLRVFPNPFTNQLSFVLTDDGQKTIYLYDFLGHQILRQEFANSTTLNTEQLVDGIYFYELKNSYGTLKTGKVVKK
jgi:hypothetical protein